MSTKSSTHYDDLRSFAKDFSYEFKINTLSKSNQIIPINKHNNQNRFTDTTQSQRLKGNCLKDGVGDQRKSLNSGCLSCKRRKLRKANRIICQLKNVFSL